MIDYTLILTVNYPDAQWTLNGDLYDGLVWLSESPKPTQEKLDALWESSKLAYGEKKQTALSAKKSALSKLAALGLNEDEIKALVT